MLLDSIYEGGEYTRTVQTLQKGPILLYSLAINKKSVTGFPFLDFASPLDTHYKTPVVTLYIELLGLESPRSRMVMIIRWQIIIWCVSEQLRRPSKYIYIKSYNNGYHLETCNCKYLDYLMMKVSD